MFLLFSGVAPRGWYGGRQPLVIMYLVPCYYPDPIFLLSVSVSSCIPYHPNHIHPSTQGYPVNDPHFILFVICVVHPVCRLSANDK